MKMNKKPTNKYLEHTIGLIQASIAGTQIGANFLGLEGKEWHYDYGVKIREMIDKDIRKLYKYAYNLGKKTLKNK